MSVSNARVIIIVPFNFYSLQFQKEKSKMLDLTTITIMIYFWLFIHFQLFFWLGLVQEYTED